MSNNLYYSKLILCLLNKSNNDFCYFSSNFYNFCNNLATVSSLILLFHILLTLLSHLFCPYMTTLKSHIPMSLIRLHHHLLLLYFDMMTASTFTASPLTSTLLWHDAYNYFFFLTTTKFIFFSTKSEYNFILFFSFTLLFLFLFSDKCLSGFDYVLSLSFDFM